MALSTACATPLPLVRFSSIFCHTKDGDKKELAYYEDETLFDVLTKADLMSSNGTCMGGQACGKCKIKVIGGNVPKPEEEEIEMLGDAPSDIRLACAIPLGEQENGATFQII